MAKRTWLRRIIYFLLIAGIVILGILYFQKNKEKISDIPQENPAKLAEKTFTKKAEVLQFGSWQPDNHRRILGTVQSSSDISIYSDLSGDIAKVFVDIGDNVYKGEIIAKFSRENDISQISYNNAVRSLETAKISTENSVRSAEIALENARNDLEQAKSATNQNNSQIFNVLYSQAKNAETTIANAINWSDRLLDATESYDSDPRGAKVGSNNSILKNDTKNLIRKISRDFSNTDDLPSYQKNDSQISQFANKKMNLLRDTQKIARNMDTLIRGTTSSRSFSEQTKSQLTQEINGIMSQLDGNIISLESAIENSKSGNEQINSTILSAENRVKNAESSLNMAKSSAENQLSNSQNQINLAGKSIQDLNVRAPFEGKISAKFVKDFDRVNPGQKLFSIVSKNSVPEVIAYLSAEETQLLNDLDNIKIELSDGETIPVENVAIAGKLDRTTQKMEAKFSGISDKLLIGSIANILLPINSGSSNLIPISAISFEPDGAEVFVVNTAKKVERRKIQTGKIVSSAVEVLGGLESREILVKYRNRVNAGDLIEIKK